MSRSIERGGRQGGRLRLEMVAVAAGAMRNAAVEVPRLTRIVGPAGEFDPVPLRQFVWTLAFNRV
jgi:hypothetical protein